MRFTGFRLGKLNAKRLIVAQYKRRGQSFVWTVVRGIVGGIVGEGSCGGLC